MPLIKQRSPKACALRPLLASALSLSVVCGNSLAADLEPSQPGATAGYSERTGSANKGSLFNSRRFQSLTADHRAFALGDSVTVLIIEQSQANTSSGSNAEQSLSVGAELGTSTRSERGQLGLNFGRDGANGTQRQGQVRAQLSAQVIDKDANGQLLIRGRQIIVVNGKEQIIHISGRVHPAHIDRNNVVLSTRLSDARIEYDGITTKKQNVFKRFANWLGF